MSVMDPEVHTLTGAYACDALEPAERAAFEEHLAMCQTCTQEVAELRATVAMLAVAATEEPPARLKQAVDARIAVTRQIAPRVTPTEAGRPAERATVRRRPKSRFFSNYLGWGLAATMACVVAVLGVRVNDQQQRIDQSNRQAAAMATLLAAPDTRSGTAPITTGGKALVLVSRARDTAAISISGLTAPPPGKAYQLWMIGPEGVRSGGMLPAVGSVVAHGLGDAKTIGLTLEPVRGSAQPTTPPVLLLPMPV